MLAATRCRHVADRFAADARRVAMTLLAHRRLPSSARRREIAAMLQRGELESSQTQLAIEACLQHNAPLLAVDVLAVLSAHWGSSRGGGSARTGTVVDWPRLRDRIINRTSDVGERLRVQAALQAAGLTPLHARSGSAVGPSLGLVPSHTMSTSSSSSSSQDLVTAQATLAVAAARRTNAAVFGRTAHLAPNPAFETFYLAQGIVRDAAELQRLIAALQQPPPSVMRIDAAGPSCRLVVDACARQPGLQPVPWFPDTLCWRLNPAATEQARGDARHLMRLLTDRYLARFQSPSSLLPVLLLSPRGSDLVADMCAAPGSKTTQVVDALLSSQARGSISPEHARGQSALEGAVVAFERDGARFAKLRDRVASSAGAQLLALVHGDASSPAVSQLPWTKVLVDAECSGDGLLHRDPRAWRSWHPHNGIHFHEQQVTLLDRAVRTAVPGAAVVYSTCTMSPLENEAVVAEVLRRHDGEAEAEDANGFLGHRLGLPLASGLATWRVPGHDGTFLTAPAPRAAAGGVASSLFPPPEGDIAVQLRRCCRVYPHLHAGMDAFFVAKIRKRGGSPHLLPRPLRPLGLQQQQGCHQDVSHGRSGGSGGVQQLHPGNRLLDELVLGPFGIGELPAGAALVLARSLPVSGQRCLSSSNPQAPPTVGDAVALVASAVLEAQSALPAASTTLPGVRLWSFVASSDGDKAGAISEMGIELTEHGAQFVATNGAQRVVAVPPAAALLLLQERVVNLRRGFRDQRALLLHRDGSGAALETLPVCPHHQRWTADLLELTTSGPVVLAVRNNDFNDETNTSADSRVHALRRTPHQHCAFLPATLDAATGDLHLGKGLSTTARTTLRFLLSSSRGHAAAAKLARERHHAQDALAVDPPRDKSAAPVLAGAAADLPPLPAFLRSGAPKASAGVPMRQRGVAESGGGRDVSQNPGATRRAPPAAPALGSSASGHSVVV